MNHVEKESMIGAMEAGYPAPEDFGLHECPMGHTGYHKIVEEGSFSGYAGGTSYWAKLDCGDLLMDESGDVAAAR